MQIIWDFNVSGGRGGVVLLRQWEDANYKDKDSNLEKTRWMLCFFQTPKLR